MSNNQYSHSVIFTREGLPWGHAASFTSKAAAKQYADLNVGPYGYEIEIIEAGPVEARRECNRRNA